MDFYAAKNYILNRLENELPEALHYHGAHHTLDVFEAAMRLAEKENIIAKQLVLLKTAALFHDAGFLKQYSDNEHASVEIVKSELPRYGYNTEEIGIISDMILSTKLPQNPSTLLDKILCDADLDYLGRDDFFTTAQKLLREWNAHGYNVSLVSWYKQQLNFIENHKYYTDSAKILRQKQKMIHLAQVRELVEGLEGNSNYSELFKNLPVGVYRSTPEGKLLIANKKLCKILGYKGIEELIATDYEREISSRGYDRARFKREIEKTGKVENFDSTFIRKDGTQIFIRESARLVKDSKKNPLFYDGIVSDITESALKADQMKSYYDTLDETIKSYKRFVPIDYLKYLKKDDVTQVKSGDASFQRKTIVFTDIRRFSSYSEEMNPIENFNFINSYFKRMIPKITDNSGFVDKLIGDSIMAVFNESPVDAIKAAYETQSDLYRINRYRQRKGLDDLAIAIGIHFGDIMVGTLGSVDRLEMTVISDAVNIAARLQNLSKQYNAQAIVSDSLILETKKNSDYFHRYLGPLKIKGRVYPIDLYEMVLFSHYKSDIIKIETKDDFEDAVVLFIAEEYNDSLKIFNKLAKCNKDDKFIDYYINRCQENINN
ncbi:MAG: adenylate/guanylate cyclase domain-containing protein [Bacteroidota bacterium]